MSFAEIFDFTKVTMLVIWIGLFLIFNILGVVKKKSIFNLVILLFSMAFLIIHFALQSDMIEVIEKNIIIDFISIIISISLYIYVDEIEVRREVISEVFENRYKNRRKK